MPTMVYSVFFKSFSKSSNGSAEASFSVCPTEKPYLSMMFWSMTHSFSAEGSRPSSTRSRFMVSGSSGLSGSENTRVRKLS